jgi:hypothetical protein
MSTSAAIAASASASATAANTQAQQAMRKACEASVIGYEHNTATISEMHGYAQCVERLHPQEFGLESVLMVKMIVAALMIAAVAGAVDGCVRNWHHEPIQGAVVGLFAGVFAVILVFLLGAGAYFGINFLLS